MRVSYQHANIRGGNESTLLRFTTGDGTRACILVDAGDGVDLDSLLGDDEYLNAILLTHGHIDHYRTLAKNVRHNAPIYASPATATVLERALPEAQKDNDLGDVSAALDALEPIDDWTSILHDLEVRPVPAGHTPGAAGFVVRFREENAADGLLKGEQHLLVTGDFTTRPCAGFSGMQTSYPFDIDTVFLNVSTDDSYPTALNSSLQTVLERAYAGSRVVVATSSLTGVHYATLLGHVTAELDRELPITLVGQAAKLYNGLELDVPGVETREVFDRTAEVLDEGGVTIAGPETPKRGSASRLLRAIEDDPAGVFVQLATGNADRVSNVNCTTRYLELRNHPSLETIDEFVRDLAPKHVVVKHAMGDTLNRFQRRFDHCFTWGTNDEDIHCLYENGEWLPPGWIAETTVARIRTRQREVIQNRPFDAGGTVPSVRRESVDLEAEGVDIEPLENVFARGPTDPYATSTAETDAADAADPADAAVVEAAADVTAATDGAVIDAETDVTGATDAAVVEAAADVTDATDAAVAETETDGTHRERSPSVDSKLLSRLEEIESKLDRREETVRARVLTDGDSEQLLQLLGQADVRAGDVVEITIAGRRADRE